ncbi:MAG TPA: hypothetical protein VMV47_18875 [Bacteroidales bacterium]|nr:hypothetical protein [Bacteroidales bacterium]
MEKNAMKNKGGINRNVVTFTFFLILSFALWYINSLGKETEADVPMDVRFVNVPKGLTISDDAPSRIDLTLKGPGYSILKHKYPLTQTSLSIDLSTIVYKRVPESKSLDYYIIASGLIKPFSVQLRSDCSVVSVKTDTLFLSFNRINPK